MKILMTILGVLLLLGCSCGPQEKPVLIDTVEGCNVYKIDAGRLYIYTTVCPGSTVWTEQHGKGSTHVKVDTQRKTK